MRLATERYKKLLNTLVAVFSLDEFDEMLRAQLGLRRAEITSNAANFRTIVRQVIDYAENRDKELDLLRAARESNPSSQALLLLAQEFGRATEVPPYVRDDNSLQRTIDEANGMLNVVAWRTRLAEIEHQICRIEFGWPPQFGTGFLLGSDAVMTNYHVIKKVHKGEVAPSEVNLRFDYALMADSRTPNPGTVFKLVAPDWLVDYSEYSPLDLQASIEGGDPPLEQLDYALLRVADSPGDQPVGGSDNRDPEAPPRGWIDVRMEPFEFVPNSPLFIMQHPDGRELKLAMETRSIISVNGNGSRVKYRTNTEKGSSGSPCFDVNWNLIALHHAGDPNYEAFHKPEYNQGIPFTAILNLLEKRGKEQVLGR